jgi:DNA gyrase/topoisomerase IV subunit B
MEVGQTVWIWNTSGDVIAGEYKGRDGEWLKVDIGSHIVFKPNKQIFTDEAEAKAWQLVRRVKRLLNQGIPMEEIVFSDDEDAYNKAMELFPEELI